MSTQNDNKSVFDVKTIIAIAAVAVVYFGWQKYLTSKYPSYGKPQVAAATGEQKAGESANSAAAATTANPVDAKTEKVAAPAANEQKFSFSNDKVSFELTNHGMGLKNFTLNDYQDHEKNNIKLGSSETDSLFEMRLGGSAKPLEFNVTEQAPGQYTGVAQVGEMTVKRELKFDAANSSFQNTITITKPTAEVQKGISLLIPEKTTAVKSKSFFMPSYTHQDFFVGHDGKTENINFSGAKENVVKEFDTTSLVSVSSQYFAAAILDKSDILPKVKLNSNVEAKTAQAELLYLPAQLSPELKLTQVFYAGPKSIDALKAVDPELANIIDFGFFGTISRPLLYVMKAFYSLVGNWGLAIIFLTLLVRLCVLPFNLMSAKSMKAMQKVQPKIQALREKYKEDPMRLNQEMMAVMKQNGANPMGGCLPMLIQIPVFFALYRVIGNSIELYHSPFVFWITDLSSADKFYVLPVLMSIFMFLQQKMTPSTMDPTQAKIMAFMPLMFCVFMLQLPSGLTLYMTVSGLFGIIQQMLIMRDRKATA
jgi:YidC/Oxa1 family membrane protein insertase